MSLLRRVIGGVLRRVRLRQGRTLREVAQAAGVSLPYLSEVERGRKEASSEVLAAVCRALGINLSDLLEEARDELRRVERRVPSGVALARLERVPATRDETSPRLRIGFHADGEAPRVRATTGLGDDPVTGPGERWLEDARSPRHPVSGTVEVTGTALGPIGRHVGAGGTAVGRVLHAGGATLGTGAPPSLGWVGHGALGSGSGLRVRLIAPGPARRPGPRTDRMLARRRARAGRRRLTPA